MVPGGVPGVRYVEKLSELFYLHWERFFWLGVNHFHQILRSILAAEMFHHIPHRYLPQSTHTVTPVNIECVLNVAVC